MAFPGAGSASRSPAEREALGCDLRTWRIRGGAQSTSFWAWPGPWPATRIKVIRHHAHRGKQASEWDITNEFLAVYYNTSRFTQTALSSRIPAIVPAHLSPHAHHVLPCCALDHLCSQICYSKCYIYLASPPWKYQPEPIRLGLELCKVLLVDESRIY